MTTCLHCGSPIVEARAPAGFCCTGCSHVHGLIASCGLGKYYELRGDAVAPVAPALLEPRDFSWLAQRVAAAAAAPGPAALRLGRRGVSCLRRVWVLAKI